MLLFFFPGNYRCDKGKPKERRILYDVYAVFLWLTVLLFRRWKKFVECSRMVECLRWQISMEPVMLMKTNKSISWVQPCSMQFLYSIVCQLEVTHLVSWNGYIVNKSSISLYIIIVHSNFSRTSSWTTFFVVVV